MSSESPDPPPDFEDTYTYKPYKPHDYEYPDFDELYQKSESVNDDEPKQCENDLPEENKTKIELPEML